MTDSPVADIGYQLKPPAPPDLGGCLEDVLRFEALPPAERDRYRQQAEANAARGCPMCRWAVEGTGDFGDYPTHARKAHMLACANPDSDYNRETRAYTKKEGKCR